MDNFHVVEHFEATGRLDEDLPDVVFVDEFGAFLAVLDQLEDVPAISVFHHYAVKVLYHSRLTRACPRAHQRRPPCRR